MSRRTKTETARDSWTTRPLLVFGVERHSTDTDRQVQGNMSACGTRCERLFLTMDTDRPGRSPVPFSDMDHPFFSHFPTYLTGSNQ